jgi:quercetin dioxygenase-like cupin family protein
MTKNIVIAIAFITGLGLIFIGARFLIAPEAAEISYGIHFNENGDYSFHYIKGIRDLLSGLLICVFVLSKQTKALGTFLLLGTMVPIADMLIVLSKDYNSLTQAIPHISAIVACFSLGFILLRNKKKQNNNHGNFTKIIQSAATNNKSIIEFKINPNEKTPWHYHTHFSETFEVLEGTLEVGQSGHVHQLQQGDIVTIKPCEKHYFHNTSKTECLLKVTVNPGNLNFENSLLISKGLAKDGLASTSGIPKRLSDLALFVFLNNSKMTGIQKIAEPLFNYLAKRAIKKGRLKELTLTYCRQKNTTNIILEYGGQ